VGLILHTVKHVPARKYHRMSDSMVRDPGSFWVDATVIQKGLMIVGVWKSRSDVSTQAGTLYLDVTEQLSVDWWHSGLLALIFMAPQAGQLFFL
jgi:hypothetical protein